MKKDSLQKVFRKYIGIYDNIIFEKTGEHLKEEIIDKIKQQVNSLFEKYENIEELSDYINFSEKLIIIIKDVINDVSDQGKSLYMKALNDMYAKNDLEIIESIIKQVKESALNNGMIPGTYPFKNIYDRLASKYGYKVFIKNLESLENQNSDFKNQSNEKLFLFSRKEHEYNEFLNDEPIYFTKEVIDKYFKGDNFEKLCLCKNSVKNEIISYAIHYEPTQEQLNDKFIEIIKENGADELFFNLGKESTLLNAYRIMQNFKKQWWHYEKNSATIAIYNEALNYCKDVLNKSVVKRENIQEEINFICDYLVSKSGKSKYFNEAKEYINSEFISEHELTKIFTVLRKLKVNPEDLNVQYASLLLETISILILNIRNNSINADYDIINEYIKKDVTYYAKDEMVDIDLLIYFASEYKNMLKNKTNILVKNKDKNRIKELISSIKEKITNIVNKFKTK